VTVYGLAALRLLNPNYKMLAQRLAPQKPVEPEPDEQGKKVAPVVRSRRRNGFVNSWR